MKVIKDTIIFHVPKQEEPKENIKKEDNGIQYSQVDKEKSIERTPKREFSSRDRKSNS